MNIARPTINIIAFAKICSFSGKIPNRPLLSQLMLDKIASKAVLPCSHIKPTSDPADELSKGNLAPFDATYSNESTISCANSSPCNASQ